MAVSLPRQCRLRISSQPQPHCDAAGGWFRCFFRSDAMAFGPGRQGGGRFRCIMRRTIAGRPALFFHLARRRCLPRRGSRGLGCRRGALFGHAPPPSCRRCCVDSFSRAPFCRRRQHGARSLGHALERCRRRAVRGNGTGCRFSSADLPRHRADGCRRACQRGGHRAVRRRVSAIPQGLGQGGECPASGKRLAHGCCGNRCSFRLGSLCSLDVVCRGQLACAFRIGRHAAMDGGQRRGRRGTARIYRCAVAQGVCRLVPSYCRGIQRPVFRIQGACTRTEPIFVCLRRAGPSRIIGMDRS